MLKITKEILHFAKDCYDKRIDWELTTQDLWNSRNFVKFIFWEEDMVLEFWDEYRVARFPEPRVITEKLWRIAISWEYFKTL
jgi:hypothetical protein